MFPNKETELYSGRHSIWNNDCQPKVHHLVPVLIYASKLEELWTVFNNYTWHMHLSSDNEWLWHNSIICQAQDSRSIDFLWRTTFSLTILMKGTVLLNRWEPMCNGCLHRLLTNVRLVRDWQNVSVVVSFI